ncbi:MAG: HupE/UreJ family protein, partial [Yoonia sp.]|uniref:HupE/UreJ family protein n=1 Tax=Yoonia sp. TaxID=2212373 RepID=UPI003EF4FEB4
VHGFGLSSKLQDLSLSKDGLIGNMITFNIGVEVGQVIALTILVALFSWLRDHPSFGTIALNANVILFGAGLVLFGFQITGYFITWR